MMAFIRVIALALALASSSVLSSHPPESARDQYEAREDSLQPQLLTKATDHRAEVHVSGDFIKKTTNSSRQVTNSDHGDGFVQEELQDISEKEQNYIQKEQGALELREKRATRPFSYQIMYTHPLPSIAVWQPPVYQLSRPYYIPIFGVPGRIPIYYPPQPIYVNQGEPKDNPVKKPFKGPGYLPPVQSTTDMNLEDRFSGGDTNDDRPIWDITDTDQQPESPGRVVPTRRPQSSRPRPPLIHNPTDPEDFLNVGNSNNQIERFPTISAPTLATRPPPQMQALPQRPAGRPNEPSRCVWAIISCCSGNNVVSYDCFEQRGCPGAFWDSSPCDSEFAQAAISAALNYYNKK